VHDVNSEIDELKRITKTDKIIDLSKALGVSTSTIRSWRTRGKIPQKIIDRATLENKEDDTKGTHINLPFYEISASAGNGTLVENEELEQNISFRADWLRKDLGVNPKNIFIMLTKGDSMDPTIKENALIMVDKNTEKHTNGIYVLRFNGELLVKRLQFTMSNTIKVISDNKAYDTEEINPEQLTGTDLEIIGRVVWSGQRM